MERLLEQVGSVVCEMAADTDTMTDVQAALWPSALPTDRAKVAALYNAGAQSYGADTIADGWDATFEHMRPEFEAFLKDRQERGRGSVPLHVLDAGCGDGLLPEHIAMPAGTELTGCDLSERLVAIALRKGAYRSLCVADCGEPQPFRAGSFDFVFCNGVLGYLESSAPLAHLVRVLRSGGRIVLCFRWQHWQERQYEQAVADARGVRLLRLARFDPYPRNPAYKHDYVCATILKE